MSEEREPLSRERVVEAALTVIDESGVQGCSMRAVASELGVEAMSLYHHVPGGKAEMMDGVVALVQTEFVSQLEMTGDWRDDMGNFSRAYRATLSAHPNVVAMIAARPSVAYRSSTGLVGPLFNAMEDAGFSREDALRAVRVVSRWTIGFTMGEASAIDESTAADEFDEPLLVEVFTDIARGEDDVFEFGLEALLDGLQARLDA
ncbi:MAG: TetR/AcrR family transcriptional regulator C-terminal domain-containing protein [Actinomycetota bacterium]